MQVCGSIHVRLHQHSGRFNVRVAAPRQAVERRQPLACHAQRHARPRAACRCQAGRGGQPADASLPRCRLGCMLLTARHAADVEAHSLDGGISFARGDSRLVQQRLHCLLKVGRRFQQTPASRGLVYRLLKAVQQRLQLTAQLDPRGRHACRVRCVVGGRWRVAAGADGAAGLIGKSHTESPTSLAMPQASAGTRDFKDGVRLACGGAPVVAVLRGCRIKGAAIAISGSECKKRSEGEAGWTAARAAASHCEVARLGGDQPTSIRRSAAGQARRNAAVLGAERRGAHSPRLRPVRGSDALPRCPKPCDHPSASKRSPVTSLRLLTRALPCRRCWR